jgi:hypothetical protein
MPLTRTVTGERYRTIIIAVFAVAAMMLAGTGMYRLTCASSSGVGATW